MVEDEGVEQAGIDLDYAFVELRPAMLALAYRITGSRADAEDIVQECFLRFHSARPEEAVRSLKAYLGTITARLSLNRLRDQKARRETYIGEWLPEPLLTADEPAIRAEDVSFALLVVLERLSPVERVVFVLRNAFDFDFAEIGKIVGRDAATCRKAFSRARTRVLAGKPGVAIDRERHRALVRGFLEATRGQHLDRLVSLLDEEVVLHGDHGGKAVTAKKPIKGSAAVAQFVLAATRARPPGTFVIEVDLNGALGLILRGQAAGSIAAAFLFETDGARIRSIYSVANPNKLAALGRALGGTNLNA
ncbi:MAG TPA: RNA polymerase sigma factor SigJ [Bradyrhizobium sp.]|nr:RNA polymerase sigma factor SigJ [Bradyrhizobium sp.]